MPLKNGSIGITTIGNFGYKGNKEIKIPEIYFLNNGVEGFYKFIAGRAFCSQEIESDQQPYTNNLLREIHLPESITTIGDYAFGGCVYLEDIHLPNALKPNVGITTIGMGAFYNTGKLKIEQSNEYDPFAKLTFIGVSAFFKAGKDIYITKIPLSLTNISSYALSKCDNISIQDFSSVQILGHKALEESGKNQKINIILPTSLNDFADGCFLGYATNNINTITYIGGGSVEDEVLGRLGLPSSNPITIEQVVE